MALLTPGILLKLLEHIGSDAKVAGAHRSAFLQVVGIVPAIAESDHLWPRHGFYLKVSDSSHCTYMSLAEEHDDLILSNKLQLGQLIQVDKLDSGSPVPILTSVRLLPGKHPFVGTPSEITLSESCDFLRRSVAIHQLGLPLELSSSERRRSLGADNRVATEKPAEKIVSWKCPEFSGSKVYPSPSNKLVPGRRSVERSSWSLVGGASLSDKADKKDDSQQGRVGRTKVFPEFSPVPHSRSVSASPARDCSVRSSLFVEKGGLSGGETASSTAKGSPNVRRSYQKNAICTAVEASSRYRQTSPAVKRAASVGKVGQIASTEQQAKTTSNPLRKSVNKWSAGEITSNGKTPGNEFSRTKIYRDENDCQEKKVLNFDNGTLESVVVVQKEQGLLREQSNCARKPGTDMSNVTSKRSSYSDEGCSPPQSVGFNANFARDDTNGCTLDALPSALATLGKKALQRRLLASYAASEALQEASASQSIIQSLSTFEELCTTARAENPAPVIQEFLSFHRVLLEAVSVMDALTESRLNASPAVENDDTVLETSRKARIILDERGHSAISWVNAALSSGLSPCPSWNKDPKSPYKEKFDGKCCKNKMDTANSPARGLSKPPFCPLPSSNSAQEGAFMSPITKKTEGSCKKSRTMASECHSKLSLNWELDMNQSILFKSLCTNMVSLKSSERRGASVLLDWAEGTGCTETSTLAKQLREEAEAWFLKFVERALDSGYKVAIKEAAARRKTVAATNSPWPDDNSQVSAVLSDLKRVNDWLDHMIAERGKSLSPGLEETTDKLKKKLYDLLIQLVLRSSSQVISHNVCS